MPRLIRLIFAVVACGLALQAAGAFAQGTFFLKTCPMEAGPVQGLADQQARWLVKTDKPDGLKGIPANLGKRVYYYSGEVAGRQVTALVESGRSRVLYVDLDSDQDLSDEKPVTGKRCRSPFRFGWSSTQRFGPLTFSPRRTTAPEQDADGPPLQTGPPIGTKTNPSRETAPSASFLIEQIDLDYLIIRPTVCRRGTARIGNKSYSLFLTDGNYNGSYGDVCRVPLSRGRIRPESIDADLVAIDLNHNGSIEYNEYRIAEMQPLTRLIQFQGNYYSVDVAPDGSALTLDAAVLQMGTIDIGGDQNAELLVRSDDGIFQVSATSGECRLPAGKYRLWSVILRQRDENKAEWTLQGQTSDQKPLEFDVEAGQVTALKMGPPLRMETSERSHRSLLSGRVVTFGASCVDSAGIEYQAWAERGNVRGVAPSVKIVDEAGKTLSAGQFEYG